MKENPFFSFSRLQHSFVLIVMQIVGDLPGVITALVDGVKHQFTYLLTTPPVLFVGCFSFLLSLRFTAVRNHCRRKVSSLLS